MPPKRKAAAAAATATVETVEKPAPKKAKGKVWVPFDPSLPKNTKMPDPLEIKDEDKKEGVLTIASYNVAGLNASIKKGFSTYINAEDADIVCLQEHKVNAPLSTAVDDKVYKYRYWAFDEKKGYAGVAVFSKYKPSEITYGLPGYESNTRGRVISLTFPSFTLINTYVPNAGAELVRLGERQIFNGHMEKYIRSLQKKGVSVVWTGDLNVAHTRDDLARPDTNQRSAGFTIEERTDFSKILSASEDDASLPGLIDTWRYSNPEQKGHYTYYSFRFQARLKLIGWRLDYFCVTPDLLDKMVASKIRHECWGASDHVPLVLLLKDVTME
ncbi:Endonuclease/exonuclease/phosphatase [Gongronella butleri]|nr:Endonuclease/exonuclease/phosphatase [Gongronella butleri]